MKLTSLQPFVPSGKDFEGSKAFFQELGFKIDWEAPDYVGLMKDACAFILQRYDNQAFAENLMLSVYIENAEELYQEVLRKQLPEKYPIRINPPIEQPYGKEVNLIDLAGVCWHFIEP